MSAAEGSTSGEAVRNTTSIDLDGLDPAVAPGVSHHEPGGLTVRDILNVLHAQRAPLVGADIVELNPDRDINGMTATVAAKLVRELCSYAVGRASSEKTISR